MATSFTLPRRLLIEAVAIILLGIALGISVNYRLVLTALGVNEEPPKVSSTVVPAPAAALHLPTPIELAELQRLLAAGSTLLDARNTLIYAEGHLPGAVSLPLEEVSDGQRPLPTWPKEKTILVYCGGYGCEDSFSLAMILSQAGYGDVRVFEGGYPQWVDAHLPVEKGGP